MRARACGVIAAALVLTLAPSPADATDGVVGDEMLVEPATTTLTVAAGARVDAGPLRCVTLPPSPFILWCLLRPQ